MNRTDLEKHMRKHGAKLVRHGARHDLWESEDGEKESQLPRHNFINKFTARKVCEDLGVPRHPSL